MTSPGVEVMAVVVPVHNEADHLGSTLCSIASASAAVDLPVLLVTVLDRCSDGSRLLVDQAAERSRRTEIRVVEGDFATIGTVRNAGLRSVSHRWPHVPLHRIWTAHTDADTRVPTHWLTEQAEVAASGIDLVIGTAVPDEPEGTPAHRLWWEQHNPAEGHTAIHGANLGIRMGSLLSIGGFTDRAVAEDVATVRRLQAAGVHWCATDRVRVITSARRTGRILDGFAGYMRDLDDATPHKAPT